MAQQQPSVASRCQVEEVEAFKRRFLEEVHQMFVAQRRKLVLITWAELVAVAAIVVAAARFG